MLQDVTKHSNLWRDRSRTAACACLLVFMATMAGRSQAPSQIQPAAGPPPVPAPAANTPVAITLDEAIHRAQTNEPNFVSAGAANRIARLDRSIARNGLLPSATWVNGYLYTQGNGQPVPGSTVDQQPPKFIANNAIREYVSQASVTESIGITGLAAIRRADAAAAIAAAELEIARRGLVSAVTSLFYSSLAADHKLAVAQRAHQEASDFLRLTDQREQAREAAHADVVKAQLQEQQRQRELQDATVMAERARLELGVLLFPDPRTLYSLQADAAPAPLAPRADIEQAAAKNNPELRSALANLSATNADVLAARAAYLPDFGLSYNYGIDAPQFAVKGPDGTRNLGYSASVTLDIPLWDWFSTQHRIKQSEIRRDVARTALTTAQRQLIARLDEAYSEAVAARDQLASLEASVATAGESLRLTKLRYNGGEATVLEVVDAQSAFVLAENALEDGRLRYETARANLQTLTGIM
jgi:outer membrane protein TolC